jgi:FkbM family methyltransferase
LVSNRQIMSEKDQRKLERKLFNDFIKKREFSPFEKDALRALRATLDATYSFYHEDFYKYLKANKDSLDSLIKTFDTESRSVVKSIIDDAEYIDSHNFVDMLKDLFSKEEEIFKHLEMAKSYKHFQLSSQNYYEQNIFDYRHGLVFLPKKTLKFLNDKDFLDCGAYIGDSAIVFEKFFNPRKIYAFEPDKENYASLLETVKLNNLKKVIPIKMGVGAFENTANFLLHHSLSRVTNNDSDIKIEVTTIDKYVSERNLDVGLIKMDVEGFELDALKGAVETIKHFKPVLSISIYHNAEQFINVIKFVKELAVNFKVIIRHLSDLIPIMESYLIAW